MSDPLTPLIDRQNADSGRVLMALGVASVRAEQSAKMLRKARDLSKEGSSIAIHLGEAIMYFELAADALDSVGPTAVENFARDSGAEVKV